MEFDRNSNYVLAESTRLKKKIVLVVARLRNHGKYSSYWIDFVCDDIAHSLME
jgi:hypothetical protein